MYFKQFYLGCLAHASYLIGDEETKTAIIVDPQRDIDQYLQESQEQGFTIRHVFLTHFHADFIAGHIELRDRTGAKIYLGARADADYEFTPVKDGGILDFGKVRIKIFETPGHTPEGISLVVYDLEKDPAIPYGVLTGDTLFIGDVGRPDLLASFGVTAEELAADLYDSLHQKLLQLPDKTLVYPAHGAGSMCGRNLSTDTVSTMGVQRQYNYSLQPMDKEDFIKLVTSNQPEAPQYFSYDAVLNRKERPTLEEALETEKKPLSLEEVLKQKDAGAQLLDVRDAADFAGSHLRDSLNIGLGGSFATWAGTLLDRTQPIIIIAEPGREREAAMRLGRIGFDNVAGYLKGGMQALDKYPDLVHRTERITAPTLSEKLSAATPPLVLDVRTEKEWKENRIGDSLNIPLNKLEGQLDKIPRDKGIVVHCGSGYRSSIAASLMQKHGITNLWDLVGGFGAWKKCCPDKVTT
ncbi:MBL fold metallo-hydrolase [Nitrosococcus wardiae]|uniref:MBL fold metallo-hydrolase n=1 Tax=Nitrosococcus wardiae TaxID=1814290 RepID=A0A4P7C0E9_9GAMM|nr:MBL fold metallo-hydrolase [Nitrosococcus wardiae]QBQ55097.1 MBL fold metallo-hydrolase [Nitrosococcus wardiae]